jgi:hypothetical protein
LYSINSQEDFDQFKEFLELRGYPDERVKIIVDAQQRKQIKAEHLRKNSYLLKHQSEVHESLTIKHVFDPNNITLQKVPTYVRYVAYIKHKYGVMEAQAILGMDRMTMWRLLNRE